MKILFLCVANSARSQMAEGLARNLFAKHVEIVSAGSEPSELNPMAVEAMAMIGIDISPHYSKAVHESLANEADLVITLCEDEVCPVLKTSTQKLHWPFEDPAACQGGREQVLASFEIVRDQIKQKLLEFGEEKGLLK